MTACYSHAPLVTYENGLAYLKRESKEIIRNGCSIVCLTRQGPISNTLIYTFISQLDPYVHKLYALRSQNTINECISGFDSIHIKCPLEYIFKNCKDTPSPDNSLKIPQIKNFAHLARLQFDHVLTTATTRLIVNRQDLNINDLTLLDDCFYFAHQLVIARFLRHWCAPVNYISMTVEKVDECCGENTDTQLYKNLIQPFINCKNLSNFSAILIRLYTIEPSNRIKAYKLCLAAYNKLPCTIRGCDFCKNIEMLSPDQQKMQRKKREWLEFIMCILYNDITFQ